MALLKVDGLEIEVQDGSMVWFGPAECSPDAGQATFSTWEYLNAEQVQLFKDFQQRLSATVKNFMEDNQVALQELTDRIQGLRAEGYDM